MPFDNVYAGRRVLVTGHTGFKGSWLAHWLDTLGAVVAGIALDPDTSPSHWQLLPTPGITDLRMDLGAAGDLASAVNDFSPEFVFHLAAQPLVRRSYREPAATFATNVMGLVNLFEAIRSCPSVRVVVNATTDKVYAEQALARGYREDDRLGGHDPYSTSKACAEAVTECYRRSYFDLGDHAPRVRIASARAGNVIGGGDWAEDRLVPDLVRAALASTPLLMRHPNAIRPWQHVLEPLSGYLRLGQLLARDAAFSGAWNFGPGADGEQTVAALVASLTAHWPAITTEVASTASVHEAAVLRLDCAKADEHLGWRPVWGPDETVSRTANWYRAFHERRHVSTDEDIGRYVADARAAQLAWAA